MSIYALVKNNQVINTIEWDGEAVFDAGEGVSVHPADALPQGVTYPAPVLDTAPNVDELKAELVALLARLG